MRQLALFLVFCWSALAQTAGLMPVAKPQYFDNNGRPLARGRIHFYAAGTSTEQATFTDSTGTTPNQNPVILDASGRASIWGPPASLYKVVAETSTGVQIWSVDNVGTGLAGSGGSGGYLPISGGTMSGSVAFASNGIYSIGDSTNRPNVIHGNNLTAYSAVLPGTAGGATIGNPTNPFGKMWASSLNVAQTGSGATGRGGYLQISPITYPNLNCLDYGGNPVNQPLAESSSSPFGAHDAILWVSTSPEPGVNPPGCSTPFPADLFYGLNVNTYLFALGGYATNQTSYNSFDSLQGGMHALSFSANNYVNVGHHAGVPTLTTYDAFHQGALYWDDTDGCMKVYNGTSWACLGSGAGSGSPGGVNTNVQFNNSSAFGGSTNFTWNNSTQLLTVTAANSSSPGIAVGTGFIKADAGFLSGTCTQYNCFQVSSALSGSLIGGMAALSFTAQNYIQTGNSAGAPTPTTGDAFHAGAMYWDTGTGAEKVYDGASWISLGGGTGSPGGSNTSVQYNSSGAFGGDTYFTYNPTTHLLTVNTTSAANPGIAVGTGFIYSEGGFLSGSCTQYNCFQASSALSGSLIGGMAALSFTAQSYIQTGTSSGAPTATTGDTFHAGAMYWDTVANAEQIYNGSAWVTLGGAGAGSPGGATNTLQYNGGGTFAGSGNLTWNNASQLLTVTAANSSSPGIAVGTGFIKADGGFLSGTCTAYNCFQVSSAISGSLIGGMAGLSFTAQNYIQTGNSAGAPSPTSGDTFHAGAMYWDTAAGAEKVYNGSAWVTLSGGSGAYVPLTGGTMTGALAVNVGSVTALSLSSTSSVLSALVVNNTGGGPSANFMQDVYVNGGGSGSVRLNATAWTPATNGYVSLGDSTHRFLNLYGAGTLNIPNLTATGTVTLSALAGFSRCAQFDASGNLGGTSGPCSTSTGTVTSIATTGPITGGTITGSGTIACPSCLTTAGGQTITSTDVFAGIISTGAVQLNSTVSVNYTTTGGVTLGSTTWVPANDNIVALGSSSYRFASSYFRGLTIGTGSSDITIGSGGMVVPPGIITTTILASGNVGIAGTATFSSTIVPPSGTALNGTYTCTSGQHINQIVVSQGFVTGYSCN